MGGSIYSAWADVTDLVKLAPKGGEFWVADMQLTEHKNTYAGWSLVTVLSGKKFPFRDINVFSGLKTVSGSTVVPFELSGFITPKIGPVVAKIGTIAYEGDMYFDNDQLSYITQDAQGNDVYNPLSDALSPADNFFSSAVSHDGANDTNRNPAHVNNFGFDSKIIDATGLLENEATKAKFAFKTDGDVYYPALFTTQIDLFVPEFDGDGIKSVKNLSNPDPSAPAKVGDILEYTITTENTGQDAADNFVLTDTLQPGTKYVPGSLKKAEKGELKPLTDEAGDDLGEVADGTVTVRLGKGADATKGGLIDPEQVIKTTFRVEVLPEAAGKTIEN